MQSLYFSRWFLPKSYRHEKPLNKQIRLGQCRSALILCEVKNCTMRQAQCMVSTAPVWKALLVAVLPVFLALVLAPKEIRLGVRELTVRYGYIRHLAEFVSCLYVQVKNWLFAATQSKFLAAKWPILVWTNSAQIMPSYSQLALALPSWILGGTSCDST